MHILFPYPAASWSSLTIWTSLYSLWALTTYKFITRFHWYLSLRDLPATRTFLSWCPYKSKIPACALYPPRLQTPSHFTHQKETNFDSQGPSPGSSCITYHLHDTTISYLLHNFMLVFSVSWNSRSWLISWSLVLDTVSTYPPCRIHCGHWC